MEIRALEPADLPAVEEFLQRVPEGDRTFFKEAVDQPGVVAAWLATEAHRWLATEDGAVLGYVAVVPLHGWSSHVGEIRLVVDPKRRGQGVGKSLARHALVQALRLGLSKAVVEVLANQDFTVEMFRSLGFTPEALLEGHVRDRAGESLDVLILGHSADEAAAAIEATGIADSLAL